MSNTLKTIPQLENHPGNLNIAKACQLKSARTISSPVSCGKKQCIGQSRMMNNRSFRKNHSVGCEVITSVVNHCSGRGRHNDGAILILMDLHAMVLPSTGLCVIKISNPGTVM